MLVVTRKNGDSLIIELEGQNETIEIKVLENGNQVKLGVLAPQGCKVWRNEIYQTVIENRQAAISAPVNLKDVVAGLPK